MTERDRLMVLRQFLRGGYRELTEPTTIVSGSERLFVVIPEVWQAGPRSAHPEPDGASLGADRAVSPDAQRAPVVDIGRSGKGRADGTDGQTEAPQLGGTAPPAGRKSGASPRPTPARRPSTQSVLDRAAKEGRTT